MSDDDSFHDEDMEPHTPGGKTVASRVDPQGFYMQLGVSTTADDATIRKAFRTQSSLFHPDKYSAEEDQTRELMARRFHRINEAYQVLGDVRRRAAYDLLGKTGVEKLALVPEGVTDHKEIARHLDAIKREAEIRRTAKLLSAHGSITAQFNIFKYFQAVSLVRRKHAEYREQLVAYEEAQQSQEGQPSPDQAPQHSLEHQDNDQSPPVPHQEPISEELPEQQQQQQPEQMQVQAQQVMLNGKPQWVLIPPPQVQAQLEQAQKQALAAQGIDQQPPLPAAEQIVPPGQQPQQQEQQIERNDPQQQNTVAHQHSPAVQRRHPPAPPKLSVGKLWPLLLPTSINAMHNFQHPVGQKSVFLFSASAEQEGKKAKIGFSIDGEHHYSPITTFFGSVKLHPRQMKLSVGFLRMLSPIWDMKVRLGLFDKMKALPSFAMTFTRKLSSLWKLENELKLSLFEDGGHFNTTLMTGSDAEENVRFFRVGLSPSNMNLAYHRQGLFTMLSESPWELSCVSSHTLAVNPFHQRCSLTHEGWWIRDKTQRFGLGINVNMPLWGSGASLTQIQILYKRGSQSITLPVVILAQESIVTALCCLLAPSVLYRVGNYYAQSLLRRRSLRDSVKKRSEAEADLREERARALAEQKAMESAVNSKRMAEDARGGLIIANAKYGVLQPKQNYSGLASSGQPPVPLDIDVTLALQSFVRDSELMLPPGTKAELPGFFDPHPFSTADEPKQLKIVYWFSGRKHECVLNDEDPLVLPRKQDLVRN